MKNLLFILVLTALAVNAFAEKAPLIRWHEKPPETDAKRTGSLIRLQDSGTEQSDTFAGRCTTPGIHYLWQPSRDNSRATGGAALLDCCMSRDGSAVVLLEQLGEAGGISGAGIVVLDVKRQKVIAAHEFLKKRIVSILPVESEDTVLLALEALDNERFRLLRLDVSDGGIIAESPPFYALADAGIVWFGDQIVMAAKSGKELMFFAPDDLKRGFGKLPLEESVRLIFAGGTCLIMVSDRRVSYGNITDGNIMISQEALLPKDFQPAFGAVSPGGETLLLGEPGGECMVVSGGFARKILDGCGRTAAWIAAADGFALNILHNDTVTMLAKPDFSNSGSKVDPGRLRPATRGDVLRIFSGDRQKISLLIVDHRANVFSLELKSRRLWRKNMIYQPQAE